VAVAGITRAVDDELRFHFEMTVKDLMNSGMNPDDARREAERRFGDIPRTRQRLAEIDRARIDQQRARRMVERLRAGSALRDARPSAQAWLRRRSWSPRSDSASAPTPRCSASSIACSFRPPSYLIAPDAADALLLRSHYPRHRERRSYVRLPNLSRSQGEHRVVRRHDAVLRATRSQSVSASRPKR
jgi:hypothetical protein